MTYFRTDGAIIILYFILCLVLGISKKGDIKTVKDYGIGGRNFSNLLLITTILATDIGAGSSIGVIQSIYKHGMPYAIAQLFGTFSWYISSIIFPKGLYKFRGCISLPDIIGILYGTYAKYITVILSVFMTIPIIAAQISGIGLVFKQLLDVNYHVGVIVGFGVVLIYSVIGGIRAVVWTDFFQFFALVVAIPLSYTVMYNEVGGILPLLNDKSFQGGISFIREPSFVVGTLLYESLPGVNIPFMQRVLMANSYTQLKGVLISITKIFFVYSLILCVSGLSLRILFKDLSEERVFFLYINNFIPIGVKGAIIAGLLAIIMSSADSWLNSVSIIVARNLFKELFVSVSEKNELLIARMATIVVCFCGFIISMYQFKIMDLLFAAVNLWNPILLMPTLVGFLNIEISKKVFYYAAISGILGAVSYYLIMKQLDGTSLFVGVICNAVVVLVSQIIKNKKRAYG